MKRLSLIIALLLAVMVGNAQTLMPKGMKVGKVVAGTNIITIDSIGQYSTNSYKLFKGATQLQPYIPSGFKIDATATPSTLTATELGYVDGVTSAIQTQLDAKLPKAAFADSLANHLLTDLDSAGFKITTSQIENYSDAGEENDPIALDSINNNLRPAINAKVDATTFETVIGDNDSIRATNVFISSTSETLSPNSTVEEQLNFIRYSTDYLTNRLFNDTLVIIEYSATPTYDYGDENVGDVTITLSGDVTTFTLEGFTPKGYGDIQIIQDGTGGWGIAAFAATDEYSDPLTVKYINNEPPTAANINSVAGGHTVISYKRMGSFLYITYAGF